MRLTSFFTFTLASAVLAASFSALATPVSAQSEPTLRYGTPEAAYSNGLSSDEFYDRFAELRDQGNAGSPNTPPTASTPTNINGSSVVADAVDNPPSVSEVRASTTANWLGFIVTGAAVQGMGSAEEVYMAWPDDRDSATDAGIYFTRSLDGGLTWSTDQRIDRAGSTPGTAGIALNLVSDNHGNILIVWDDSRNGSTIQPFYSVSHDRGATWSTAALIDSDADMGLSIMDAAVDPAGNFYLTWHDFRSPSSAEIYAASSLDRGNTWKPEVKVSDPTGMSDVIPRIVAPRDREVVISWLSDRSAGAHDDVFAARSIDGGATFATDTRINSNAEGSLVVVSNKMCSDGNGNIYAAYGLYTSGAGFMGDIYVATSNDFGASWSAHKKIDGARIQGSGLVITALDCVFDGQNGHAVVGFSGSTDGSTSDDAFTSVSSDAGATWQSAQRVNTGLAPLAGHDPLGLSVGIDPRGHVLTAWNDTRSGSIEIYFNYSNNFGDTWASTDIRMNGGTPGAHDAILTNENFIVLSTFAEGTNGTHNTDRLAFHNTFFDDRAGAQGMYDGIVEFTGDMQVLNRLAGANRIETSVAINQDLFPTAGTAPAVVISTSENFPDGLAAGPLAAMLNGSLLLNPKDSLDPAVALEITRVLDHKPSPASNIYVVGGPAAISDAVIAQLQGISSHARVAHIFGQNRYETAIAVAEQMDQIRGSGPTGAMLTTGENFPDALSASGPASDSGINPGQMPILLVTLNGLEPEVSNYLDSVKTSLKNIYTVGGPSALSEAVSSAAAARVPGVVLDRLAGLNRYETATAVARFFYTGAMLPQGIGLASGEKFPDALGGGRASGAKHRPLVLTTKDDLTATSSSYIGDNAGTLDSGDVYGGTAVIDESIVGTINLMI